IYTLSLHDALPILGLLEGADHRVGVPGRRQGDRQLVGLAEEAQVGAALERQAGEVAEQPARLVLHLAVERRDRLERRRLVEPQPERARQVDARWGREQPDR